MLSPADVKELLDLLHAQGYRLRKLSADGIEVAEAHAALELPKAESREDREAALQFEAEEAERDKWAHIPGGKPAFLREPKRVAASPWHDGPGEDA